MSKKTIEHNPNTLKAYREAMPISIEMLAKKTGIATSTIEYAENSKNALTLKQLKKLADTLVISETLLLLDEVYIPEIPNYIDHRNKDNDDSYEGRYELKRIINQVYNDRENLIDIQETIDVEADDFTLELTGKNEEEDANRIRNFLEIDNDQLKAGGKDYYLSWRSALEAKDILVFEKNRIKIGSEGLALYYSKLPIIVILTSGQTDSRRLFTMMHELVHLGLRQSCVDGNILTNKKDIETYCNRVAGHVLAPKKVIDKLYNKESNLKENIENIRAQTKASKQAIAIQLKIINYINDKELNEYISSLTKKGIPQNHKKYTVYNQYGKGYLQQVIGASWQGSLSISAAMRMLGLSKTEDFNYLKNKAFQ